MTDEACGNLFSSYAENCAKDALRYLYRDLLTECEGDADTFFSRLHEKSGIDGRIIDSGKTYALCFRKCECPLHTEAGMRSAKLCACSEHSMQCVFSALFPNRPHKIEKTGTILAGDDACRFIISFKQRP